MAGEEVPEHKYSATPGLSAAREGVGDRQHRAVPTSDAPHGRVLSQDSIFGQNPKIGCQECNDLQTPKLSKKQLCDRTVWGGESPLRGEGGQVDGMGKGEGCEMHTDLNLSICRQLES
jgi:hypothetical protein